jgi:hypothetical protein
MRQEIIMRTSCCNERFSAGQLASAGNTSAEPHRNNPLWGAPGFSRRQLFRVAGTALTGYFFARVARPMEVLASANAATRNTARNCIFVFLTGAASGVDTFDLKEGSWLPKDFAPTTYNGLRFPQGLMPKLAGHLDKMAIARSVQAWAAVHSLAQTWTQIARNPAAALGKIAPNIGAVVALEKETPGAKLPGFIALNATTIVGAGYFDSAYAPFSVTPSQTGLAASTHPDGKARFDTRVQLLDAMDGSLRKASPLGEEADSMGAFAQQARSLMYDATVDAAFKFTSEDHNNYGASTFGDACVVARNILKANLGARYIQIQLGGWDHHQNIYDTTAGIYPRASQLDSGLATLLADLAAAPGSASGKSLLDETLVVCMGEFGRTVGAPNNQAGRDHFLQQFAVFAGGGTRGGRAIGATSETGAYTADPGWERNRSIRPEDIAATIYSALGIDWTIVRHDDPFGRGFEYIPFAASDDAYGPVNAVFE